MIWRKKDVAKAQKPAAGAKIFEYYGSFLPYS